MIEPHDHRLRQREYLLQISRALSAQLDLNSVLSLVITYAVELLAGTSGLIALFDEEGGDELRIRAFAGLNREILPAFAPLLTVPLSELQRLAIARAINPRDPSRLVFADGAYQHAGALAFREDLTADEMRAALELAERIGGSGRVVLLGSISVEIAGQPAGGRGDVRVAGRLPQHRHEVGLGGATEAEGVRRGSRFGGAVR